MIKAANYIKDFLSLIFPELCAACGRNLFSNETALCTKCIYDLPKTNFHLDPENRVARQLWGRIPFVSAHAFLHFQKGTKVQNIMHQLKYNNRTDAGLRLGELYGDALTAFSKTDLPELIVPVPLHISKQKARGYNQSEFIANGIGSVLSIPVDTESLIRVVPTETQTHRSRFSRYENMLEAFAVRSPEALEHKHIVLLDDVITTGATLEACAILLTKLPGVKISVAALAFAD